MTDLTHMVEAQGSQPNPQMDTGKAFARRWGWIFVLMFLWVFGIRIGCLAFLMADMYVATIPPMDFEALLFLTQPENAAMVEDLAKMSGIFLYPVQILGVAVIPALLARWGLLDGGNREKRSTVGLLALGVAFMPVFLFVRGMLQHPAILYTLLYLMTLGPCAVMGIALRKAALHWREGRVALYIGLAFALEHVTSELGYYSWIATENAIVYLGFSYLFFAGILAGAVILRLRMPRTEPPALPAETHVYPPRFSRHVGLLLVVHGLFSSAINTVIYFENMDDFHTLGYELLFMGLALLVMLGATLLYHRRRWLAPALVGLLLICFGQGLTLFGIQSIPLAIAYNLITMVGKVPPLLLAMILPVYYAVSTRKPGLACLGFAIPCGADFLLNLTQLTEKGIEGALPGNSRQGVLLFVGLCLIAALFYLYTRFERTRTDTLLKGIRESRKERKSTKETIEGLDLTAREKEVTNLLLAGDSQKMIAAKLHVSLPTVSFHIGNLYRKLHIQSKAELFALFLAEEPKAM